MLNSNRKQVNASLAKCFAWCSLVLVVLMISTWVGIFHFSYTLRVMIICVGAFATMGPICLQKMNVPDVFLQYYMHIVMAIFIGLLGTNNGIGIYITYVMVPLASALYFDRKFTLRIAVFCYVTMTFGVYFNTAGKMEVIYKNWPHWICFRNYMLGFTLEYVVIMLFIYQIVKRARQYMVEQQVALDVLQEENDRQKEISNYVAGTMDSQRRSILEMLNQSMKTFTQADFARLAAGHRFIAQLQDTLRLGQSYNESMNQVLSMCGEYFGLDRIVYIEPDFSNQNNKISMQWARTEEDALVNFYSEMSPEEADAIRHAYDERGFLSVYLGRNGFEEMSLENVRLTLFMEKNLLGGQLWIPTLTEGQYDGAVCFDRRNKEDYSSLDIFLLSEVVSMISMNVTRMNADNSNRAKSAFLSSMSHEIRTPMNAILGMTTVALREQMSDSLRRSLSIIRSSSEGLLAIINDILDFSKIESGKVEIIQEEYNILSLLNDVTTIVEARNAEKRLKLIYDFPDNMPSVLKGDMVRIKQVMVNLAGNAVKYTDTGSVTMRLLFQKLENGNANLHFEVVDTGQGIRPEDIKNLFKSFTQINQEENHHKEGTGLGLAISKQLVELMNGKIGVESTFGEGSIFYFDIPQYIVDPTPAGKLEDYEYVGGSGDIRFTFTAPEAQVLIVDDNEINLMVAEALFEPFQMKLTLASSGKEALSLVQNNVYDLIFMDHFMPDMDGVEVTQIIRALEGNANRNTPIIALTADAVTGVKEKMLAAGMNDFLSKPIDLKLAKKVLKQYLPVQKVILAKKTD